MTSLVRAEKGGQQKTDSSMHQGAVGGTEQAGQRCPACQQSMVTVSLPAFCGPLQTFALQLPQTFSSQGMRSADRT